MPGVVIGGDGHGCGGSVVLSVDPLLVCLGVRLVFLGMESRGKGGCV